MPVVSQRERPQGINRYSDLEPMGGSSQMVVLNRGGKAPQASGRRRQGWPELGNVGRLTDIEQEFLSRVPTYEDPQPCHLAFQVTAADMNSKLNWVGWRPPRWAGPQGMVCEDSQAPCMLLSTFSE